MQQLTLNHWIARFVKQRGRALVIEVR